MRVYLFNKILKYGGPSRFQEKLLSLIKNEVLLIKYNKNYKIKKKDIIFTTGTFNFLSFIKNKIIYRVDGFLWHNKYLINASLLKYLYEKIYNLNIIILLNLSSIIIFQSRFVKKIWSKYLINKKKFYIIYNCNIIQYFKKKTYSKRKIICVEGNFDGAFNAFHHLRAINDYEVELYGNYSNNFKKKLISKENIIFKGHILFDKLQQKFNKKNIIFFSLELYPACSNSVIEAMSYGIPVVGFRTGCMNEFFGKKYKYLINHNINQCSNFTCLNNISLDSIFREIFMNYNSISKNIYLLSKKFHPDDCKKKYLKVFNLANEK